MERLLEIIRKILITVVRVTGILIIFFGFALIVQFGIYTGGELSGPGVFVIGVLIYYFGSRFVNWIFE
jgi:hypothetical protein